MASIDWPSWGQLATGVAALMVSGLVTAYGTGRARERINGDVRSLKETMDGLRDDIGKVGTDMKEHRAESAQRIDRLETDTRTGFSNAEANRLRLGEFIKRELDAHGVKIDAAGSRVGQLEVKVASLETTREEHRFNGHERRREPR